jgi:tape measure domain-containing protein
MSIPVGGVTVYFQDDTSRFQSSFRATAALVEQSAARMRAATANTEKAVRSLGTSTRGFAPDAFRSLSLSALRAKNDVDGLRNAILAVPALAGGFGGAILAQQITQRADAYTNLKNRIASVVEGQRDQIAAERDLFEVAQRTRSSLQSNAALFARLRSSSATLAGDPDKLLRTVETVQKSFQVGGATTAEAQSAALQLAQALGSGRLQGDELRSILENNIPLAKLIAKEFGVGVGQLKDLGSEGTLTADRVIKAILDGSQEIDSTFNRLKPTFAQSLQVLDNSLTRTIGKFDEATGLSAKLAGGIIGVANNLDGLAQAGLIAGGVLASVFAGRTLSSLGGSVAGRFSAERERRAEAVSSANAGLRGAGDDLVGAYAQQRAANLRSIKLEEDALKRVNAQATNNMQGQIQLQEKIDGLRQKIAAGRQQDSDKETAAAIKNAEKQQAALDKLAAARLRDQQAEAALAARLGEPMQGDRKGLKPLYEAAFDRDSARDARLAAESRAAAIRSELARIENEGPASRKKKDIATFEGQRDAVRQALTLADQERIASLQKYYDAEEKFRVASENANSVAEKKKTSALKTELRERESARTALANAEQSAAKALAVNAPAGTDSKRVLADLQAISKAEAELATVRKQGELIARAQTLQQGAVSAAAGRPIAPTAEITAAANNYRTALDNVAAAQQRATIASSAMGAAWGAARAVGSSLFAFLGGPWGVALTLVTGGMAAYGLSVANAAAEQARFKANAEGIPELLQRIAAAGQRGLGNSLRADLNTSIATAAQAAEAAVRSAGDGIAAGIGKIDNSTVRQLNQELGITPERGKSAQMALYEFSNQALNSKEGTDRLRSSLEALSAARPDLSPAISEMLRVIGVAAAATSQVNSLRNALAGAANGQIAGRKSAYEGEGAEAKIIAANAGALRDAQTTPDLIDQSNRKLEVQAKIEERIATARRDKRASRQEELKDQILADSRRSGAGISEGDALRNAKNIEAIEYATAQAGKGGGGGGGKKGFSPEERFDNRVSLLREQGRAAFFTDLDRELISQLKELKSDPGLAKRTTDALISGGELPERAKEMRAALELKKSGELAREARDQYGTLAEVLPLVAERQRLLNLAVAEGAITQDTANRAAQAYATTLPAISKAREGTDKLVDGLAEIGLEALTNKTYDWKKALASLAMELTKLLVLAPLLKQLKDSLAGGLSGGSGGGGGIFGFLGGLLGGGGAGLTSGAFAAGAGGYSGMGPFIPAAHNGAIVPNFTMARAVSPSAMIGAQRFHSGLKPNEFSAILERGEAVLTKRQQSGIAAMTAAPNVKVGGVQVNNYGNNQVEAKQDSNGMTIVDIMDATNARGARQAMSGRGPLAPLVDPRAISHFRPG